MARAQITPPAEIGVYPHPDIYGHPKLSLNMAMWKVIVGVDEVV